MTIPKNVQAGFTRVSDVVRDLWTKPGRRAMAVRDNEMRLLLQGQDKLYELLTGLIRERIDMRAALAMPADPLASFTSMARDKEAFWLLSKLEYIRSAVVEDDGEQPEN